MTVSHRADTWARGFLWLGLLASLVGFLGYYDAAGFVTPPPFVVLALQLIAAGGGILLFRTRLLGHISALMPLLLVAAWAGATLLWAEDPTTGLRRWLLVFVPGILLCAMAAADTRPRHTFNWFLVLVVTITIASGSFSALVSAFSDTRVSGESLRHMLIDVNGWTLGVAEGGRQSINLGFYVPRFSGLTSNPNSMGLFAAIALVGLCAVTQPKRDTRSAGLVLIIGLVAVLLLLSASRAAFAMAATGIFVVFLLRTDRRRMARAAMLLICGSTVSLYLMTWLSGAVPDPGNTEIFELRERAQVWGIAIQAIGNVWPLGLGFGLTQEAIYAPLGLATAAHSVTLSILLETGMIGLVLVLIAWFHPALRTTQANSLITSADIAIVALLLGLFVHQTVDSSVFRYHWAHFVFVYLLGASAGLAGSRTNE